MKYLKLMLAIFISACAFSVFAAPKAGSFNVMLHIGQTEELHDASVDAHYEIGSAKYIAANRTFMHLPVVSNGKYEFTLDVAHRVKGVRDQKEACKVKLSVVNGALHSAEVTHNYNNYICNMKEFASMSDSHYMLAVVVSAVN